MKDLIKTVNNLPLIVKLLLCIPVLEIFYSICRVVNGVANKSVLWIIIGILTIVPGAVFMWLVDLICVLLNGHAFGLG